MHALSRRTMLKALGVSVPLPFLDAMLPRTVLAAAKDAVVPSRMLVCHFGTGMNIREFFPQETGAQCVLPRIMKPLEAWRQRMTIVSGLKLEHGGGHTGDYTYLTGTEGWTSTGIKSGISADQVVATAVGKETQFQSLQLSVARGTNYGQQGLATLSWNKNGIPLAAENDPQVVFQRLFGIEEADESAMRQAGFRRRGSILDYVRDQAKQMERDVGGADRQKLDEYFTSVREIEQQLQRDRDWSQRPKPKPELPNLGDYSRSLIPATSNFDYAGYQKLMYDLIALAFQTDSTRVITYNVRQEIAGGTFPIHQVSKGFHALTHHNNDPKNLDELAKVDEINMGFWARFMERMSQTTQPDGRSLLDHTVIAFSSGAGMDHSRDKLPTAVFGGEALGVKHSTHIKLKEGTPLARVWHTMADRMGVKMDTLQDSRGPISELISDVKIFSGVPGGMKAFPVSMSIFHRGRYIFLVMTFLGILSTASLADDASAVKNSLGMTLRLLPAGRYERGENDTGPVFSKDHSDFNSAEDDRPVHPVVLTKPFYLATTEVTVGQFRKFVEETGYKTSAEQNKAGAVGWDPRTRPGHSENSGTFQDGGDFSWKKPGFAQQDDHPVVCISFADAQAFCAWLSQREKTAYRLPTEAEWEYAARAGTTTFFSFGNDYRGQIQLFANIGNAELEKAFPDRVRRQWLIDLQKEPGDQHVFTAPVGSYRANPWGLFDLYGNVWEWCEDRYLDTAYTPFNRKGYQEVRKRAIDPLNLEKSSSEGDWRVIRGGSWFNAPIQCRSSVRGYFEATDAACYLGFRVAREASAADVAEAHARFERAEAARTALIQSVGAIREVRDGRISIQLQLNHLTDDVFKTLKEIDEPLDVTVHAQGKLQGAQISELAQIKMLASLMLNACGPAITDDDFAVLHKHPELEQLQITQAQKVTDGLLVHFKDFSRLELLQFDSEGITDAGLQQLSAQLNLKSLYVNGTASQGMILQKFQGAPLERFSCSHLTDGGAGLLPQFTRLRELSVAGSPLTGEGLAQIARLPRLVRLDLSNCRQIPDAAFTAIGSLSNLHSISLTETSAGDRAAEGLAKLNELRDVRLGSDQLSDAGVRQLCNCIALDSLVIEEKATGLTDAALTDLWRLVNLGTLELTARGITGTGLSTVVELPRLQSLNLNGPDITNVALQHASRSKSLKRLGIGNWRIGMSDGVTDSGLLALSAARDLKQIDLIRRHKQISDEALGKLRTQRPDITINVR